MCVLNTHRSGIDSENDDGCVKENHDLIIMLQSGLPVGRLPGYETETCFCSVAIDEHSICLSLLLFLPSVFVFMIVSVGVFVACTHPETPPAIVAPDLVRRVAYPAGPTIPPEIIRGHDGDVIMVVVVISVA